MVLGKREVRRRVGSTMLVVRDQTVRIEHERTNERVGRSNTREILLENFVLILSKLRERSVTLDSSSAIVGEIEQDSCREILKELRFAFVYPMVMMSTLSASEDHH